MLLKLRTAHGPETWRWIDGIEDVETFGVLWHPTPDADTGQVRSSEDPPTQSMDLSPSFESMSDVFDAVNRLWGDKREFDHEVWPFALGAAARNSDECVTVVTVTAKRGPERYLLVLALDAFLMSDEGRTIDRLR